MSVSRLKDADGAATDGLGRRERQRLETRERLYEAALAEYRTVGFNDAQIDRIAEKAGVARGTFYFHFPSKEHVLLELQRRSEISQVERMKAFGPPPESVGEFCRNLVAASVEGLAESDGLHREILAMWVRGRTEIQLSAEPMILLVADYFADAAERGAIRRDVTPERLAVQLLAALFTVFMGDPPVEGEASEHAELMIDIFVRGIAP